MKYEDLQAVIRQPRQGWAAHPTLPIYNFELAVNGVTPHKRFIVPLAVMKFRGRVEEARAAVEVMKQLMEVKYGS